MSCPSSPWHCVTGRAAKAGASATQILRSPWLLNTQPIRLACAAEVSSVGKGELMTCSSVNGRFWARAELHTSRDTINLSFFISETSYRRAAICNQQIAGGANVRPRAMQVSGHESLLGPHRALKSLGFYSPCRLIRENPRQIFPWPTPVIQLRISTPGAAGCAFDTGGC